MIKKILLLSLIVIIGFVVYFAFVFFGMEEKIDSINITNLNLDSIEDGVYRGEAKASLVEAVIDVTIKENRITNINIVHHKNWRGGPAESIIKDVIKKQDIDVDLISNATASSKIILKAIEVALKE